MIGLLALNDDGALSYDHCNAHSLATLGIPVFVCSPEKFPDLMSQAIIKQDIAVWATKEDLMVNK